MKAPDFIEASPRDGKIVDSKNQTPIHLAVKSVRKNVSRNILLALAESHIPINPFVKDKPHGRQACNYINKKDSRHADLKHAIETFHSLTNAKKKQDKRDPHSRSDDLDTLRSTSSTDSRSTEEKMNIPEAKKELDMKGKKTILEEKESKEDLSTPEGNERSSMAEGKLCVSSPVPDLDVTKTKKLSVQKLQKRDYDQLPPQEKFSKQLKRLSAMDADYFKLPVQVLKDERHHDQERDIHGQGETSDAPAKPVKPSLQQIPEGVPANTLPSPTQSKCTENKEGDTTFNDHEFSGSMLYDEYGLCFDDLPWEVEISRQVLKFLKDSKRYSYDLRLSAAKTIHNIAEGKRDPTRYAKAVGSPKVHLYRAKLTKKKGAARILWQKAIQFSSRLTAKSKNEACPIYTQVIRIWSVVPHHDKLNKQIEDCISQIESSYERGKLASSCRPLSHHSEAVLRRENLEFPMRFIDNGGSQYKSDVKLEHLSFVPAASLKENEFNVTTFYSLSNDLLMSTLTCTNERLDFPFKEWPKEHEIISLDKSKAILLLGRSGTGKTTCCLYRLWNEFKNWWDPNFRHADYKLTRKPLLLLKLKTDITPVSITELEHSATDSIAQDHSPLSHNQTLHEDSCPEVTCQHMSPSHCHQKSSKVTSETEGTANSEEIPQVVDSQQDTLDDTDMSPSSKVNPCSLSENSDLVEDTEILEDLHQVFITKNYVLCAQMKKRFYDMTAAHTFLVKQMEYETAAVPNSLDQITDHQYPLFLTARQFYILLDNSLEGEKFFSRDKEGNLKGTIRSTDYDHEDLGILLDLEESEDEEDEEESCSVAQTYPKERLSSRQDSHRWIEITSMYFEQNIWPEISHKCGTKQFDPLLVWTEIQSFIKGSEEALRKGSPLSFEEYQEVGNARASNFVEQRDKIFKVFECYQKYRQNQRHNVFLFDECDLVQNLNERLCKMEDVPWSIHSFYVDEVQDFTQAELSIFLHCCRSPNLTFFTGDTAQSIMRGIAFRFRDLQSLFFRISKQVPQVQVPKKPYILTTNFRSHSGVLHLASSIIDLLQEFFKGSVDDYLPKDEGMFQGPSPILIESCEVSDLALLLSTNKREASTIEFGAHQAILVRSKEEVHSMLQGAIVLTIFEAKGLEFDDVLLYNFFKDSPVSV